MILCHMLQFTPAYFSFDEPRKIARPDAPIRYFLILLLMSTHAVTPSQACWLKRVIAVIVFAYYKVMILLNPLFVYNSDVQKSYNK